MLHVISTGDGTAFSFYVLGTVDKHAALLEGSLVNVTSIETVGWNTRVVFEVVESENPFKGTAIVPNGALGYVDFKNDERNTIPEDQMSVFRPLTPGKKHKL